MKIRASFLFVCMAISVVLGGVIPASATSTKTSTSTAVCRSTGGLVHTPPLPGEPIETAPEPTAGISDPNDYRWILIENGVYEGDGCDLFDDYEFMSWCNNLENRPAYAELCEADLTPMITTSDLNYLRAMTETRWDSEIEDCLVPTAVVTSLDPTQDPLGAVAVLSECYTTTSEIREALES